jgi:hypothetical protein
MPTHIPDTTHAITIHLSSSDIPRYAWLASCSCGWQALVPSEMDAKWQAQSHQNIRAARERRPDAH